MDEKLDIEDIEKDEDDHTPDDEAGFYIDAHIKIFDPQTDETFVSKRS